MRRLHSTIVAAHLSSLNRKTVIISNHLDQIAASLFRFSAFSFFQFLIFRFFEFLLSALTSFRFNIFRFYEFDARGAVPIYFNEPDSFFENEKPKTRNEKARKRPVVPVGT